jgi:phenylpyruvate tautomerase PptA (4-oxalocrotonate tautomerase family)
MKNLKTIDPVKTKKQLIAEFANITVEQLEKLPSHIYVVITNNYYTAK